MLNALIEAEEYGITSSNVKKFANEGTDNPVINRITGTEGTFGEYVRLDNDWAVQAISQVGNYGEIFERHLGVNTSIGWSAASTRSGRMAVCSTRIRSADRALS